MRFINKFDKFSINENKNWTWKELKELTSRFDSVGIFKEEEEEAYAYIIKKGLLYDFFPSLIDKHIKKYNSLQDLKKENESLYNFALKNGLLTKYFPTEISLPTLGTKSELSPISKVNPIKTSGENFSKIYQALDRLDKNLDNILSNYRK